MRSKRWRSWSNRTKSRELNGALVIDVAVNGVDLGYIGNRIAQSETLYHVGRKKRVLGEWCRITSTHKHAKADLLQYFSEKQIRMLALAVDSNEFIRCAAFSRLEAFAGTR